MVATVEKTESTKAKKSKRSKKPEFPSVLKFSVQQAELNDTLALVCRAVPGRPSQPILANVLLVADTEAQKVTLSAFNLSLGIKASFDAEVAVPGSTTLPAKLLSDIISKLPKAPVTFDLSGEDGLAVSIASPSGNYQMKAVSPEEFPKFPEVEEEGLKVESDILLAALKATVFSCSDDETKQVLTGARLTIGSTIESVATDGHRLAIYGKCEAEKTAATIPGSALAEVVKAIAKSCAAETIIAMNNFQARFTIGDITIYSRLLEGQYPTYWQLVPRQFAVEVSMNRQQLLAAVDRVDTIAEQGRKCMVFTVDSAEGEVSITADTADVGSADEVLEAEISGGDLTIVFNCKYLLEWLKICTSSEVILKANTDKSPAVLSGAGDSTAFYLLMPVKIREL